MKKTNLKIPIGSQHIALLEPVRFTFTCENERIVDVDADVGYVHRGIEKACTEKFEYKQVGFVVARVCGLCAITHSLAYTLCAEKLLNLEVNKKIKYLRMLLLELDRVHSHLLCLSHTAENAGFEAFFMEIMAYRELIMETQEILTGNRVQFDYVTIGGVTRDLDANKVTMLHKKIGEIREKVKKIEESFTTNWSLSLKYKGIGAINFDNALIMDALGPMARAAGVVTDVRIGTNDFNYDEVGYKTVLGENGDIFDRNTVRIGEIYNSLDMCENIIDNLPTGEIQEKVKGKPEGEAISRVEAPRGELFYYVKAERKNYLDRLRIKTPTFSQIPAMVEIFKGSEFADAPAILASFDPCMSCTAK